MHEIETVDSTFLPRWECKDWTSLTVVIWGAQVCRALYWRDVVWVIVHVVLFWLCVMVLPEEVYGKMQVNGSVRQKDSGKKEQQKAENHKRTQQRASQSCWDWRAGGEPDNPDKNNLEGVVHKDHSPPGVNGSQAAEGNIDPGTQRHLGTLFLTVAVAGQHTGTSAHYLHTIRQFKWQKKHYFTMFIQHNMLMLLFFSIKKYYNCKWCMEKKTTFLIVSLVGFFNAYVCELVLMSRKCKCTQSDTPISQLLWTETVSLVTGGTSVLTFCRNLCTAEAAKIWRQDLAAVL